MFERPESGERPRFGINSLINRMTGHGGEQEAPQASRPARQQPPVSTQQAQQPAPVESSEPEQDQIEIPAFLRRQAN